MNLKKTLLGLLLASSFGATAIPAHAQVIVGVAPPAPRYETIPAPRAGHVWESGYWRWNGRRHVWVAGHWERTRDGYSRRSARWEERNGDWHYYGPNWTTDSFGQARPTDQNGNMIHQGGRPGDRDGDGAPDDVDSAPDDRNRG